MSDLPFEDRTDFEDADRGFIAKLDPGVVTADDGRVVWDNDAYAFLAGDCPETANPSLWRQGQLCAKQGLYQVTEGIYQVRGLDLSNMTLVEGDRGVVVIDPLVSAETAAAALGLYREHRGDRPVTAVIYTHSHVDHFGGVEGVVTDEVPVVAPEGFMEHAVSENVYAGLAMSRRALYMYGAVLERGPAGHIGTGLGITNSTGSIGLIPPTLSVTHTGQEETLDGIRISFQLTPGTEAPAEMNFLFSEHRALCMAENATHNLHNILTLRGAPVRDARVWSRYLQEAILLFVDRADVAFASHHWPTWGRERIVTWLSEQRDLYAYLHDQTLRLLNAGYTGIEIAEMIQMPPTIENAWHARGYYGSVSHNVKAIYQRYMGWFDGHPASLWELPPEESAARYVECLGGVDAVVERARAYVDAGDLRFASQLLKHAVFADPDHAEAKELLAATFERLGHGSENGPWRNFFLMGARELREGIVPVPIQANVGMVAALSVEQLFDSIAIRVDGPRAWSEHLTIDWHLTDLGEHHRMTLSNGVLIHYPDPGAGEVDLTLTLTKPQLLGMLASGSAEGVVHEGDLGAIGRLISVLEDQNPDFAIVTP
ncbi:MAG TPA: alkyl sulfatase dimerization domain-containing protein [Actinomycetota bacterium]|nr:alkyl sulfatase dimerization domain-containing protein [Actinomycetota bacterium]